MLCLLFTVANRRFCIEARNVLRVQPPTGLHPVSGAPEFISGIVLHEDQWIPVIDISRLATGEACHPALSTRLILMQYQAGDIDTQIGIIAESVDDTVEMDLSEFSHGGLQLGEREFFGDIALENDQVLQILKPQNLLSDEARALIKPVEGAQD
ncbi:MAG: chemotaxis protein CheW [bacterium]